MSEPGVQGALYRRRRFLENFEKNQQAGYVSGICGRKVEYDQENERELLETLEALVNNLGARNVTANALHLHRNTLIYRIKKIENQTGYDLSDPNSILELAFALRIMKFMK